MNYTQIPRNEIIQKTAENLLKNGFNAVIFENSNAATKRVLELIPEGSEVMTMSSATLDTIGLAQVINESGNYDSVKNILHKLDRKTQNRDMQRLGAAPVYAIGSVHAVTTDGKVLIASNTGSQLPAYAYSSEHVIWVVGAQKIVKNVEEGIKRIYEHVLPLESERLKKLYGVPSNVSKLLIINKEVNPNRITILLVKEPFGF